MFTGIVEEVGVIESLERGEQSARLTLRAPITSMGTKLGDSIAINGTCLTVVEIVGDQMSFEAVPETIHRTSLKQVGVGDGVNLERALAVGSRLGGHFVQGHVDGTGKLIGIREDDNASVLTIQVATELARYLVPKGSVCVDGISLTVVDVAEDYFTVWIIPHTLANTNLRFRSVGDLLNIEADMLAKYIEKLLPR